MAAYTPAVPPIAAILLAVVGAAWGFAADRIAARWPAHEDGSIRGIDWRTVVVVLSGAAALGAITLRFGDAGVVPAAAFLAWAVALVLLLATDLDQRLLPNELTLPMIPAALALTLAGQNPLLAPGDLPIALLVAIAVPGFLWLVSIPFGAGAIGQGDLKLLVSAGILGGPLRLMTGGIWGALLGGAVILGLLMARRITLKTYVPFGPFLIYGALAAILLW